MTSMSTAQASVIVAAVVAFSVPAAYWQIRRAMRHTVTPEQIVRDSREARTMAGLATPDEYDGPDSLLLLEELDEHLDMHATTDRALKRRFGLGSPLPRAEQLEER